MSRFTEIAMDSLNGSLSGAEFRRVFRKGRLAPSLFRRRAGISFTIRHDTGVSRYHGGPIMGHRETPRTSLHYGIERCSRGSQFVPMMPREAWVSRIFPSLLLWLQCTSRAIPACTEMHFRFLSNQTKKQIQRKKQTNRKKKIHINKLIRNMKLIS